MDVLIVVDMQNDFIYGPLGSPSARAAVEPIVRRIAQAHDRGELCVFTRDTHGEDYLQGREGRDLPIEHCLHDTPGWEIVPQLRREAETALVFDKPTYGSVQLAEHLARLDLEKKIGKITLTGVCTDVCVISNAILLRTFLPEAEISVDAACCAGTSEEGHELALDAMRKIYIQVEN